MNELPLILVFAVAVLSLLIPLLFSFASPDGKALSFLAGLRERLPWYYLAIVGGVFAKGILPRLMAYLNQGKPLEITWQFATVLLVVSLVVGFLIYAAVHQRVEDTLRNGTTKDWLLVASLYFQFGYFWESIIKDLGGPG